MGLKESGLRGSLRNVSVGIDAIPDTVTTQHFATSWSENDSIWSDDVDDKDMSIPDGFEDTTLSDDSEAISGDGNRSSYQVPTSFEADNLTDGVAIELVIETSISAQTGLIGSSREGDQAFEIILNTDQNLNADAGNIAALIRDSDDNRFEFSPESNPQLDDGSRHDITLVVTDTANNDGNWIIDGDDLGSEIGSSGGPNNFDNWEEDWGAWGFGNRQPFEDYTGAIAATRFHNNSIDTQTINQY